MGRLTSDQLQTLHNFIATDPVLSQLPNTPDGNASVAAQLNLRAAPEYWRLKTSVAQGELQNQPSSEGTQFDWASPGGFIARSQGERDAYQTMFASGPINPSFAAVRSAIDDIFSGTGAGAQNNRLHWRAVQRQLSSVFEKLFARPTIGGPAQSGNRGDSTNPDTLPLDAHGAHLTGPVTAAEVAEARAA